MDSTHSTLLRRLQKLEDYIFFSVVAAALGLAALSAYILVNRAALKLQEAWAAPLVFLIAGAVLLGLAWQRQNVKRALSNAPAGAYPAAQPAPVPLGLRLLLGAAALGYLALFVLVGGVSLRAVYNNNHFAGLVFGIIYALLTALEALAAWNLRGGAAGADLWSLLLPGGLHLARMGAFWLGFAVPLVTMGLQAGQLPQVNAFFQRNKPWLLLKDVPDAAVLGLALLYFALLEGLLGQAGGAWQRLNRGQPVLPNKWAVVARWVLALALAYPLGGLPLLVLAALLVLWQALALGRGAGWPQRRPGPALMLLALGPALFYLGGALTWLGSQWSYAVPLALLPAVYFLALAHAAGQLRAEPEAPGAWGQAEPDPLHSLFSQTRIRRWQSIGYAAAGFASLLVLVLLILAENCRFYNSILSPNFARCIPTGGGRMAYFELGPLNGALLAFDLVILCLLVGLGLSRLLRPLGGLVERLPAKARRWLGWGLIGVVVVLVAVAMITERGSWLAAAVLVRGLASGVRSSS